VFNRCKACQYETLIPKMWLMLRFGARSHCLWQRHEWLGRIEVPGCSPGVLMREMSFYAML
jgi:hypothetical protein